jgi:hypothetical protein
VGAVAVVAEEAAGAGATAKPLFSRAV